MKLAKIFTILGLLLINSCTKSCSQLSQSPQSSQSETTGNSTVQQAPKAELKIEDIKKGTGPEVKNGDIVLVHYVGTLVSGQEFDSSRKRNEPFRFTVGKGEVIPGWEKGLIGMQARGLRKLTIPPHLAYGETAIAAIPANSTLLFEIELLQINPETNKN